MIVRDSDSFVSEIPASITGYSENTWMPIFYEDDVSDDEKIPGLTGFLESIYKDEIVWAANCRLDNDEYRFPEDRIVEHTFIPIIPIILSKNCPPSEYEIDENWIREKVDELLKNNPEKQSRWENCYVELMKSIPRKLGEYHHGGSSYDWKPDSIRYGYKLFILEDGSKPFIKLYYRNLKCSVEAEYCDRMKSILAHEYFHFVHDRLCGNLCTNSEKNVVEALADFFGAYLVGGKVAESDYMEWEKWNGSGWPYSYALNFFISDADYQCCAIRHPAISEKFESVLATSCRSMANAFDELVN